MKKSLFDYLIVLILVSSIVFAVFGRSLGGQFVTADDIPGILNNPDITNFELTPQNFYFPYIYQHGIVAIFGKSAFVFHLLSVLTHIAATMFFYFFSSGLLSKKKALLATLLFSVHPVVTEATVWISGANYLIYGLVTFWVLGFWVRSKKKTSAIVFGVSLIFTRNVWFLTIPLMIATLEWALFGFEVKKWIKNLAFWIIGVFCVLFFAIYMLPTAQKRVYDLSNFYNMNADETMPVLNRSPFIFYKVIELLVIPANLSLYQEGNFISKWYYKLMIVVTLAYFSLVFVTSKKHKTVSTLLLMIFLSLAPSFSPILVAWFVAERYMYAAVGFFAILFVLVLSEFKIFKYLFITIFFLFCVRSFVRSGDFMSSKTLWVATLKTNPISPRVYNNLGDVYSAEQNYPLAIYYFGRAFQIQPNFAEAMFNLGLTLETVGDLENAAKYYEMAKTTNPKLLQAEQRLQYLKSL